MGARSRRSELDYELEGWHLGVIATGAGAARAVRELAAGVDRRLLSVVQDERSVWAWLGGERAVRVRGVERVLAGMDGIGAAHARSGGVRARRAGAGPRGVAFDPPAGPGRARWSRCAGGREAGE